ncbi:hypothetical protein, partial [Salmonella enterica]|uniref:hypothetical protein n=1 Tax=Salmonella enterica TaxID=28901 RepID=UPI00329990D4
GIQIEGSGNHVYASASPSTSVVAQTYGTDYFVESDIRIASQTGTFGLVARYTGPDEYYSFLYDALNGEALIARQDGNQTIVLGT